MIPDSRIPGTYLVHEDVPEQVCLFACSLGAGPLLRTHFCRSNQPSTSNLRTVARWDTCTKVSPEARGLQQQTSTLLPINADSRSSERDVSRRLTCLLRLKKVVYHGVISSNSEVSNFDFRLKVATAVSTAGCGRRKPLRGLVDQAQAHKAGGVSGKPASGRDLSPRVSVCPVRC